MLFSPVKYVGASLGQDINIPASEAPLTMLSQVPSSILGDLRHQTLDAFIFYVEVGDDFIFSPKSISFFPPPPTYLIFSLLFLPLFF